MNENTNIEQEVELRGKSGQHYSGKIYSDKNGASTLSGKAIAILSNSNFTDGQWNHNVNSIYNTENTVEELEHFKSRDDISHLILVPYSTNENGVTDKVDDLIRSYIHG